MFNYIAKGLYYLRDWPNTGQFQI